MHSLIVVPARGGSKGIPKKNIYPLNGKPLLEYTLEAFLKAGVEGALAVSTDCDEIAQVARKYKDVIVIKRPDELSTDTASTETALLHALEVMERENHETFDAVITAQPTSPLRKPETIRRFVSEFEEQGRDFDSQLTFTETKSDMWVKDSDGRFVRLFPNAPRRRQERESLYVENSMLYITRVQTLKESGSVLGNRVRGFLIDDVEGLDINEWQDLALAEHYLINTQRKL